MVTKSGRVEEASVESSSSAVEWGAIVGGALAAVGVSIILFALGPAIGLSATPYSFSFSETPPAAFAIGAGIWMIVTQWLASGLGGYLTGRMRTKWVGIRTDEVFFRDTAHGFLAWALATLLVAALALSSAVGGAAAVTAGADSVSTEAAEQARQAAVSFGFFMSLSLLIGAFIGAVAGAIGGYHRDAD